MTVPPEPRNAKTGHVAGGNPRRKPAGTTASPLPTPPGLPIVDLPGATVAHDETHRQVHALFTTAEPRTFFASEDGSRLVEPGPAGIEPVSATRFATAVQRHMRFRRKGKRDSSFAELPDLTARRMIAWPAPGLWPTLRGVAHHPVLLPDGRWIDTPGYDTASGWFLRWNAPAVDPARITPAVVRWVWKRLLDYEFEDDTSRWLAMAMFVQPFVRPALAGPTPLYLVGSAGEDPTGDVPGSGAGKTCLVQTVALAALGREPPMLSLSSWGSEAERQLAGLVAREPEILLLDNLGTGSVLGGPMLHQLLTAGRASIREVGATTREITVRALWTATGNGVELDGEQIRRSARVQIRPGRTRPYLTRSILGWIRQPKTRALVAAVVRRMVEDWIAAGLPRPPRSLPSYDAWSDVVGGIVCHHGGSDAEAAWLAPTSRPRPAIEREWGRLFAAWPTVAEGARRELPAAGVVGVLDSVDAPTLSAEVLKGRTVRAMATRMGRLLRARVDRPTAAWLLRSGTAHGGMTWYRPEPLAPPSAPGPGVPDDSAEGLPEELVGPPSAKSLREVAVISTLGGTGGTGGTCSPTSVYTHATTLPPHAYGGSSPSSPTSPSGPVIPGSCAVGLPPAQSLRVPPKSHRAADREPWRREVEAMQERGVRVDPGLWSAAVLKLRAAGIEATRETADPATAERALHRLLALAAYADDVLGQAAVDPGQRVRATWDPEGTWTGRITARQPPLQSITRHGRLRAAVVPAPGCAFVVGDWSQSQLRIAFGLSGDRAGAAACAPGRDLHAEIGEAVAPGHPQARALGKLLNFAVLYLAGPDTLVEGAAERGIELSRGAAAGLIRRLEAACPALCAWRRAQAGRGDFPVAWGGEVRRTVNLPPSAFDPATGTPRLPSVLAGIMQAHEVEALHHVLEHTEERLGRPCGFRPVLLVHDEVLWEGPNADAEPARDAAERLMLEALAGVTGGVPAAAQVEVRGSWAAARAVGYTTATSTLCPPPARPVTVEWRRVEAGDNPD